MPSGEIFPLQARSRKSLLWRRRTGRLCSGDDCIRGQAGLAKARISGARKISMLAFGRFSWMYTTGWNVPKPRSRRLNPGKRVDSCLECRIL
jgi:hypothetical protein